MIISRSVPVELLVTSNTQASNTGFVLADTNVCPTTMKC